MTLWKMSIKTGALKGNDPFQWCRQRAIVGIGWSTAYDGTTAAPTDPVDVLSKFDRRGVAPAKMLIRHMRCGDLVWLHSHGGFFLCKILDDTALVGPQVGEGGVAVHKD